MPYALCLAYAAEDLHLLLDCGLDGVYAGSENLSGVEALAGKILAGLDIASYGSGECDLALGVDVDLCDAERNSLLDHILRDACSAVENKGHIPDGSLDISEDVKAQTGPVSGVLAVDVAYTGSKHRNSEICDLLALLGIGALAHSDNAVLLAADCTDLSLERNSENVAGVYKSGGELDVFLDRKSVV